ncbi:MAG: amino acid permease, partial [Chlorobi bacterium]|nr:amino acid permease [Chlorobiota bacterium]
MAKQKKFGAFSGVFTPSVLTILGVIMYMRLGWVVGSAGLITALIIIVISHVISITTGLSISSVATDKKIKTGGIYYMLSRSLGFPMGGAIGIALFVGTALGISLYLIGFAESLLSVDIIRETLHLKQDINSYRIVGSVALLLLVTIAFISTSLAIKSQYFILAAIALSLVSIVVGFITNTQFYPETILLTPAREGVDIQVIFGVFFPAVTGFTAGVAMSGDLKNPKKDIPFGTLAAIIVGFIVYVGLAISFAFFVNRDLLLNDYNFLLKVAWYSPLVLAGIWGATLSSALGGILGGPRILQAISKDKITPKIFAKGYGPSNEPRNALIFIFLIAEAGILIGELNVIAGVVSMFYLASYGFINLAFFLENWASTDFRPTFKVKGVVGLIGFIASFAVMAQLGMLSMIAALVIMFGLFAWLNRKQLKSESGDVWQSVWLSVVRRALHSLDKKTLEDRNWQPNVILFSGGKGQRPHLMEFGKDLVGQYGLLSNFDLHESENKKYLFPKHLQSQIDEEISGKGIFIRRQTCSDIYTGIETIVSTYGFSGIEPNTVILGWMRQSKNPVRFSQMLNRISELDVNILLVDYDKRVGFGNYKTIDIWWRGAGNNGNLALNLYKFLQASENWSGAKLRLLVGNPVNEEASTLRKHAEQVLSNMRINAEIKIINNQVEQKPFYELIRTESLKTDLIILGLPPIKEGKEAEFVEQTSNLMQDIGTVVLIKASSQFKNHHLGHENENNIDEVLHKDVSLSSNEDIESLILPENPIAEEKIISLKEKLDLLNNETIEKGINLYFSKYNELFSNVLQEVDVLVNDKLKNLFNNNKEQFESKLTVATDLFLKKTLNFVKTFSNKIEISIYDDLYSKLFNDTENIIEKLPDVFYQTDSGIKSKSYKVKYKKIVKKYLPFEYYKSNYDLANKISTNSINTILELLKFSKSLRNSMLKMQASVRNNTFNKDVLEEEIKNISLEAEKLQKNYSENLLLLLNFNKNNTIKILNKISEDLNDYSTKTNLKSNYSKKQINEIKEKLELVPNFYKRNETLTLNYFNLNLQLIDFENKIYRISRKSTSSVEEFIEKEVLFKIQKIKKQLETFLTKFEKNKNTEFISEDFSEIPNKEEIFNRFKSILDAKYEKLK